jgi:hypothetical protein
MSNYFAKLLQSVFIEENLYVVHYECFYYFCYYFCGEIEKSIFGNKYLWNVEDDLMCVYVRRLENYLK